MDARPEAFCQIQFTPPSSWLPNISRAILAEDDDEREDRPLPSAPVGEDEESRSNLWCGVSGPEGIISYGSSDYSTHAHTLGSTGKKSWERLPVTQFLRLWLGNKIRFNGKDLSWSTVLAFDVFYAERKCTLCEAMDIGQ